MSEFFRQRHALGLPAGSVRSLHILAIIGITCAMLFVVPKTGEPLALPPYLIYLIFLLIGHFFASHGVTIANDPGNSSPLYIPGMLVRLLIIVALAGAIGWKFYIDPEGLHRQFDASLEELKTQPLTPLIILGGFLLGVIVRSLLGRGPRSFGVQDFEAWISLIALLGLGVAALIHLVILPNVLDSYPMPVWEGILGGVVAFYFGERS